MQRVHSHDKNFAFPANTPGGYGAPQTSESIRISENAPRKDTMNHWTTERIVNSKASLDAPARTTISIVENDRGFREALTFQLSTAGFEVAPHPSAESFLDSGRDRESDCVIADIYLQGMNGLQLLAELKQRMDSPPIVVITGCGDIACGVQAMREGAVDCLEKPIDEQRLLDAVMRAVALSRKQRAKNLQRIELQRRQMTLTPREREVFALVTAGLLNKQVGATLGASERTIKTHRGRVMDKMNADSVAELVRMADVLKVHIGSKVSYF